MSQCSDFSELQDPMWKPITSWQKNKRAVTLVPDRRQVNSRLHRGARAFGKCARAPFLSCQKLGKPLLQVDGLVMPCLVELCTPDPVHPLVIGTGEDHGRAEPNVEIAQISRVPTSPSVSSCAPLRCSAAINTVAST